MAKVNLLKSIPKITRNVALRKEAKSDDLVSISKKFGKEYFDGDREYGYGGYKYDGRWITVARDIIDHFGLKPGAKILDVGCAKGFLVYDLVNQGMDAYGIDVSTYALDNAVPEIRPRLSIGSCDHIEFEDNSFDAVLAINTIHNLDREGCVRSCKEIERIAPGKGFIQVDSYYTEEQKNIFESWVLTAEYHGYPEEWLNLFSEAGYTGDWFWTIME